MGKIIDVNRVQQALDRAARDALTGPPELRAGRVLPVVSSMMAGVEYDEETCELDILFSSGKTYRYFDVPEEVYARLLAAESKGQFFNEEIKEAYRYAEVTKRPR
jgi:KTSC domain